MTVLENIHDCEDLVEGALWFGTGGGGSYEEGMELLTEALDEGLRLEWISADRIDDAVWTVTVGLHGSIAPLPVETLEEIRRKDLSEAAGEWYLAKAIKELGHSLGHEFGCVVPAELGPHSAAVSLVVGAHLNIPVVDGDYIGRAVPEETQSTYCLHGKESNLFAGVDRWGNRVFVKQAIDTHFLERIAKMLAVASYGDIAVATTPLPAKEMKQIIVPDTLTQCLTIGRIIRQARNAGADPVDAALEAAGGWRLFDGQITRLDTEDRDGYYFGEALIAGSGKHQGRNLKVWFKNENQITWLDGEPWVCSPDLVSLVYADNGRGISNSDLKEGDTVVAIGLKGVEAFRSEAGLNLAGPQHFGFDIDYVPIEELV